MLDVRKYRVDNKLISTWKILHDLIQCRTLPEMVNKFLDSGPIFTKMVLALGFQLVPNLYKSIGYEGSCTPNKFGIFELFFGTLRPQAPKLI